MQSCNSSQLAVTHTCVTAHVPLLLRSCRQDIFHGFAGRSLPASLFGLHGNGGQRQVVWTFQELEPASSVIEDSLYVSNSCRLKMQTPGHPPAYTNGCTLRHLERLPHGGGMRSGFMQQVSGRRLGCCWCCFAHAHERSGLSCMAVVRACITVATSALAPACAGL
jgi:hypothetical protein